MLNDAQKIENIVVGGTENLVAKKKETAVNRNGMHGRQVVQMSEISTTLRTGETELNAMCMCLYRYASLNDGNKF